MTKITIIAVWFASLCLSVAGQSAPLKPLNLEQSKGDVRVVLLRVGSLATTNGQSDFVVTYVVEIPRKSAFTDLGFDDNNEFQFVVHGKQVEFKGGFGESALGFEELPRQNELKKPETHDGKVMLAKEVVYWGRKIDVKKIDVKIHFQWRNFPLTFDFNNVPLN